MKEWVDLLAPKRVIKILVEFVTLLFDALLKKTYIFLMYASVILLVYFACLFFDILPSNFPAAFAIACLVSLSVCAFILYRNENEIVGSDVGYNVGFLELLTIESEDEIYKTVSSHKITKQLRREFGILSASVPPYNNRLINPVLVTKPRLYYHFHDLNGLATDLNKYINPNGFLCMLLSTHDKINNRLEFDILYAQIFNSDSLFVDFKAALNTQVYEELNVVEYTANASLFFACCISQGVLDALISFEKLNDGLFIIDECTSIFKKVERNFKASITEAHFERIKPLFDLMESNLERYRAIFFLNKGNYEFAVQYLFKSVRINPYFPYNNYEDFRLAYGKRYVVAVSEQSGEYIDEGKKEEHKEKVLKKNMELIQSMDYSMTPFFDDILKEIIMRASSEELSNQILDLMSNGFCKEPINHLIRGEILKVIPLEGSEKINELYIARIPESIAEFEKVLEYDSSFVIMHSKIGALKLNYLMSLDAPFENLENEVKEAVSLIAKGQELFHRLGAID